MNQKRRLRVRVAIFCLVLTMAVVAQGRNIISIGAVKATKAATKTIKWNSKWKYAKNSVIHSGRAKLYYAQENRKDIVVCVNAGHGTKGGANVKTLCHPDGSAKVTSGSTAKGAKKATAVAYGTTMEDGTPEYKVTLKLAKELKKRLLAAGYDVLMIRETDDVQLDNIARTVMANNIADCHIALHYDSTQKDKGAFYMSVPNVKSYRSMEPVASLWKKHEKLGKALIKGLKSKRVKIFSSGSMAMDLTQTSYSTIPSVDLEVGDRASDYSQKSLEKLAKGITAGVEAYFE
ncbi:MAG: N-acetylmuramoyl-L-alanine amidase family protein [Acetivibrio ethanolgignens]